MCASASAGVYWAGRMCVCLSCFFSSSSLSSNGFLHFICNVSMSTCVFHAVVKVSLVSTHSL